MSVFWFVLGAALLLAGLLLLTVSVVGGFIALTVAGGCLAESFTRATQ